MMCYIYKQHFFFILLKGFYNKFHFTNSMLKLHEIAIQRHFPKKKDTTENYQMATLKRVCIVFMKCFSESHNKMRCISIFYVCLI